MTQTNSTANITKALIEFHRKIGAVPFDSTNPYYKSRYASLGAVIATITPVACEVGLTWVQLPVSDGEGVGVETTIMHESGEHLTSRVMVALPGGEGKANLVQEAGKYISYLRRYSLASAFGIYADEDADGNSAPQSQQNAKSAPKSGAAAAPKVKTPTGKETAPKTVDKSARPYTPEQLLSALGVMAERSENATRAETQKVVGVLTQWCEKDTELRHKLQKFLFGAESINSADPKMVSAALAWLKPEWDSQSKFYLFGEFAEDELNAIYDQITD